MGPQIDPDPGPGCSTGGASKRREGTFSMRRLAFAFRFSVREGKGPGGGAVSELPVVWQYWGFWRQVNTRRRSPMKLISIALAVAAGFALSNSCAGAQTKTADLPNPIGGVKDLANRVERQDDPGADTPRVPRHPQGLYVILLGPTEVEDWISFDNTAFSGYLAAFAWSDLNPNPPQRRFAAETPGLRQSSRLQQHRPL